VAGIYDEVQSDEADAADAADLRAKASRAELIAARLIKIDALFS
jgi:hypothetical protein